MWYLVTATTANSRRRVEGTNQKGGSPMRHPLKLICAVTLLPLLLSACAIPLPYEYDQKIVDGIDEARLEIKTVCRLGGYDNYDGLAERYAALIAKVETVRENAQARPRRYGWVDRLKLRVTQSEPDLTPSYTPPAQPLTELSCRPPGAAEGFEHTGRSPDSLFLAQTSLERLRWCHEKAFDPNGKIAEMIAGGLQPVPDPRELRKSELCKSANDYLSDARLFESTLKIE